jgi:hypothetical protein
MSHHVLIFYARASFTSFTAPPEADWDATLQMDDKRKLYSDISKYMRLGKFHHDRTLFSRALEIMVSKEHHPLLWP